MPQPREEWRALPMHTLAAQGRVEIFHPGLCFDLIMFIQQLLILFTPL